MENRPVINLGGRSPAPGADAEVFQRFLKWQAEVYSPMLLKATEIVGVDHYQIVKENPEYPARVTLYHYKNLIDWKTAEGNPETSAITQEQRSWVARGIVDYIWAKPYALTKSFRSKQYPSVGNENTIIENAPIMHLEAYRLSPEEQGKYVKWFNEYGCPVFMPLFMKLPGLIGYDQYEDTGLRREGREYIQELEYPKYLSIIYFENLKAFEDFEKSPELAGFQKVMRSVLPRRLKYEWHVQYQLVGSLRK
jgi:hypothetical protein